jgi:ERCC4-related helicase
LFFEIAVGNRFFNHRDAAERISDTLNEKRIYSTYYHGGMDQDERACFNQFRNGSVSYLITTDLAARGLDIPEMNHVIIICLQKRMSSHIETVERHVCYLQEPPTLSLMRVRKMEYISITGWTF